MGKLKLSRIKNHRIGIHGRQTTIRMEPEILYLLRRIAAEIGMSATKLIEAIKLIHDPQRSFSSELRVYVATYYARKVPQTGFPDPASRFAFRIAPTIRLDRPRRSRWAQSNLSKGK